ncbi:MAG: hypothetical protein HY260_17510 [Chloroflexi bacterium]|nr:hypothetical protein [Chloroflexota bacterium]
MQRCLCLAEVLTSQTGRQLEIDGILLIFLCAGQQIPGLPTGRGGIEVEQATGLRQVCVDLIQPAALGISVPREFKNLGVLGRQLPRLAKQPNRLAQHAPAP